jgi:DNA-binding XRE family transcriptional regulator
MLEVRDKVKMMRIRRSLSQAEAAKVLGVPTTSYTRREIGKTDFTPEEVVTLCDTWGFSRLFPFSEIPLDSADASVAGKTLAEVVKYLERVPPARLGEVALFLESIVKEDRSRTEEESS